MEWKQRQGKGDGGRVGGRGGGGELSWVSCECESGVIYGTCPP